MSKSKASLGGVCGVLFSFELSGSAKRLFLATWESRTPGLNLHIHDVLLPSPIASFVRRKYNLPFRFQLSFDVQQPTTKIVYSDWKQKPITSHVFDTILQEQEIPTGTPSVVVFLIIIIIIITSSFFFFFILWLRHGLISSSIARLYYRAQQAAGNPECGLTQRYMSAATK